MAKIRIYELAKELGIENKILITKAQEMGIAGIKSHSNSLDNDDADKLRRSFLRETVVKRASSEVVKTSVDTLTGEKKTVVERRKGDVVRRRRSGSDTKTVTKTVTKVAKAPEVEAVKELEKVIPVELIKSDDAEEIVTEKLETANVKQENIEIPEVDAQSQDKALETKVEEDQEEVSEVDVISVAKVPGPKVLGKIQLPAARQAPKPKKTKSFSDTDFAVVEDTDEDDDSKKGKKKKGKKRALNRGDLVDYEARSARRTQRKNNKKDDRKQSYSSTAEAAGPTKASKLVVKISSDAILVGDLAKQMSLKASDVIQKLIGLGVMATINQVVDFDTATILADDFGFTVEQTGFDEEEALVVEGVDDQEKMQLRPAVVTVMGHVDHGKTSLLDYIRKATIADKEHGGITQHIGAYSVEVKDNKKVAFIDTPGHAAFTAMRARGAKMTDIVVLVVAADDGVMPQTVEAINHAKAAQVQIVIAVNKMDKEGANPDRVKQQLSEYGLQPEDWGGDTMFFPVSALTGDGIPELLEGLALIAEVSELKANPDCRAVGSIVEARQEKGRGTVATVLVQAGTLRVGDIFVSGAEYGRVRSLMDHNSKPIESAGPSTPVEITGLNGSPVAGDDFTVVGDESKAKQVSETRKDLKAKQDALELSGGPVSLEEFAKMAQEKELLELNLIIKADVQGSLEAVKESVVKLSGEKVKVKVLHGAVGGVNESDVQLSIASKALIIGFGVRGEPRAIAEAENAGIEVRFYRVIYELIDDVKKAMAGLLSPIKEERHLGRAEVRNTFSVPKIGTIAGCYIIDGKAKRNANIRLLRDSRVLHEGRLLNLRRFKDDVKEVQNGYECGISIVGYNDIKDGDVIELFEYEEVAATLD